MKIFTFADPQTQHNNAGKLFSHAIITHLLMIIFLINGCTSNSLTEFTISVDETKFSESPVISGLNREQGHLIKIFLPGYVPYSTRAEFEDRQWMFANLKFGEQILLALDINTGYLYKLLPEHMSDWLQKENRSAAIEKDALYLIIVQEPDDSTWWRNIARLKPVTGNQN